MRTDVAFIHPPSIYNFRTRDLRTGPISDVVPSTPVFEMYPIGLISMLNYLVGSGYNARISNLAVLMLSSPSFDVEDYISRLDSEIYGVDLHWLPHVHGAVNVVKTIRRLHPDASIVLGGYSATYFADEIMRLYPDVDYVLAGDLQEESILRLTDYVEGHGSIGDIDNLVYREDGRLHHNRRSNDASRIDDVFLNYELLLRNAVKYHDIRGHLPFLSWINNPMAMTLIQHGCGMNCAFCGGSCYAYKNNYFPFSPLVRNIKRVVDEIELVHEKLGAPIFIAGDISYMGDGYYSRFFSEVKSRGIDIPLLTEYFVPPLEDYYSKLKRAFPEYTSEISPESSSESIRRRMGKVYTNASLEKSMEYASRNGCRKFDVYFSIGLPEQEPSHVYGDAEYSEFLIKRFNKSGMRVSAFISPITPFLDPGSLLYEFPDRYGYRIRSSTIQDYYDLLDIGSGWEDFLNYETDRMDRKTIEETTYGAALLMADIRLRNGQITEDEHAHIVSSIRDYREGRPVEGTKSKDHHLTYMSKEIEWSHRHHLTLSSFLIFLYKNYYALGNSSFVRKFRFRMSSSGTGEGGSA